MKKFLVARTKNEVYCDNLKYYYNIVFDEMVLRNLNELFPECEIKTDYNAVKLVEELGYNASYEFQKRMEGKRRKEAI